MMEVAMGNKFEVEILGNDSLMYDLQQLAIRDLKATISLVVVCFMHLYCTLVLVLHFCKLVA
jgi:hypothetical protein